MRHFVYGSILILVLLSCDKDDESLLSKVGVEVDIISLDVDCSNKGPITTVYCKINTTNPENYSNLDDYGICFDSINGDDIAKIKYSSFPGKENIKSEYLKTIVLPIEHKYYIKPYWEYNDQIYYGELEMLDYSINGACNLNLIFDYWINNTQEEGNYIFINDINDHLLAYVYDKPFAGIPSNVSINHFDIPIKSESVKFVMVPWRLISDPFEQPDINAKTINLPNATIEKPITYILSSMANNQVVNLNLSYPITATYNVDVYLDGRTGIKIASLIPGDKEFIYLDADDYSLHYLYWKGSFNTSDWLETEKIELYNEVTILIPEYSDSL